MLSENYHCEFEILDKEYISPDTKVYPGTCLVRLIDLGSETVKTIELGYVTEQEVFRLLESNNEVDLTYCFINNFSLKKYRALKGLHEEESVNFKNLNCANSFFYSSDEICFTNAFFDGELAVFTNTIFYTPRLDFLGANFDKTCAHFEYSQFYTDEADFSHCNFGDFGLTFKNAFFSRSRKLFENLTVKKGEVSFLNVQFGDGNISFSGSNFGSGRTTFRVSIFGSGKKDFSKVFFKTGVSFEKTEFNDGEINFRSAFLGHGKVDFTRCEMGEGEKIFVNTNFSDGNVSFAGTSFGHGKVNFKLAEFGDGDVDFHFCKFGDGDKIFERTKFGKGNLDFRTVDFYKGKVSFNRIEHTNGDIIFEASEMQGGSISFRNSVFGQGVFNFENAIYHNADLIIEEVDFGHGKVTFKNSQFSNISLKDSQINQHIDLRIRQCRKLDLSNTIIKDVLDIRSFENKIEIKELDFSGMRLLGRIYIDWKELGLKKLIYQQQTSLRNKAEQFRMLKENFHNNGMYEEEDFAYVEFKRTEARADLKVHGKFSVYAWVNYAFKWLVFDKMSLYATNPLRVLESMLLTYMGFSFLYMFLVYIGLGDIYPGPPDAHTMSLMAKAFYFSVITFFTIGFGDFYPLGALRIFAGIEGFFGVFLMAYFTVAFVRKILR